MQVVFTCEEIAKKIGCSVGHIRAGCANWLGISKAARGAALPPGWEALKWNERFVVYRIEDSEKVREIFGPTAIFKKKNSFLPSN